MRCHGLARSLLAAAVILAAGCQAFHSYRPVGVLVRDAETKQPIPAAQVAIHYPAAPSAMAPTELSAATGNDGVARLQAAPYGPLGISVTACASGYQPEELDMGVEAVRAIKTAGWFEHTERRPAEMVVELDPEPRFGVELIVPVGYHGLVKADVQPQDDALCPPRQRCFRAEVPPDGVVRIKGPPVLRRVQILDFKARYSDGTALGSDMDAVKVGFRWLKREGNVQCFVIGTQAEYDGWCRRLLDASGGPSRSEGGKSQGRGGGGRRRRGSQGSSDSPS